MNPDIIPAQHRQVLDACAGQIQSLTQLARACGEPEPPVPADESTLQKGCKTPPLTEEAEAAIAVLYQHGHSLRDIGGRIGRHPQQVARILDQYEVHRRPRITKKLTDDQRHQIIERYRTGESANLLARELGVATSTVSRCIRAAGISTRGEQFKPTFDQQVFKRIDQPEILYWLGYLASPRCEVSDLVEGEAAWFRLRVPFSHEEHIKGLRRLLMAPQDKEKLVRSWETIDGVVLRVESRELVEQLHVVGIVPDLDRRCCRGERLFFSPDFWRGVTDAAGTVEADKLSVRCGRFLALQFPQYVRTLVPGAVSSVDGEWCFVKGDDVARRVIGVLYEGGGVCLPNNRAAVERISQTVPDLTL